MSELLSTPVCYNCSNLQDIHGCLGKETIPSNIESIWTFIMLKVWTASTVLWFGLEIGIVPTAVF